MAYDTVLADRVRRVLGGLVPHTEKAMFGGLAFLVEDRMALAASSEGGVMVRGPRERVDELLGGEHATPVVMRGRPMRGWSRVEAAAIADDATLAALVELGLAEARRVARA